MNKNLVYFAVFLVLLGIGFGFYPLSFVGLIILVPALLSSPRPPMTRVPAPPGGETRRIAPPQVPRQPPHAGQPSPSVTLPPPAQPQTYSPVLFPTPMFPAMGQMATPVPPGKEAPGGKQEGRDELVEVGAILALLKLTFG